MPFAAMAAILQGPPTKEPAFLNRTRRRRRATLLILEIGMIYLRHRGDTFILGSSPLWTRYPLLRMHWAKSPTTLP